MKCSFELVPLPATASSAFVPAAGHASAAAERVESELPAPPVVAPAVRDLAPLREAVQALESAAAELHQAQREENRRWLWGALDVAVALAKRVLERELSLDPAVLHPLLERAVELLGESEPIEIALGPAALALLEDDAADPLESLRQRDDVRFVPDRTLGVGEASVNNGASSVELRLDVLLSMLRDELVPEWEAELL